MNVKTILNIYVLTAGIGLAQSPADSGWIWQNPLPQGNTLSAIAVLDINTAVAVGDAGTILRTTDGGATWTLQSSGTTANLSAVSFTEANTGTAVGSISVPPFAASPPAVILRTTDGGVTWQAQSSGTTARLSAVSFTDPNTGTAVGEGGTILRTTDGGATWKAQSSGSRVGLSAVSFTDIDNGIAVGKDAASVLAESVILRTTDGGAT